MVQAVQEFKCSIECALGAYFEPFELLNLELSFFSCSLCAFKFLNLGLFSRASFRSHPGSDIFLDQLACLVPKLLVLHGDQSQSLQSGILDQLAQARVL